MDAARYGVLTDFHDNLLSEKGVTNRDLNLCASLLNSEKGK